MKKGILKSFTFFSVIGLRHLGQGWDEYILVSLTDGLALSSAELILMENKFIDKKNFPSKWFNAL